MNILNYTDGDIQIEIDSGFKTIETSIEQLKKESGFYEPVEMMLDTGETTTVYQKKGYMSFEKALMDELETYKDSDNLYVVDKTIANMLADMKPEYNIAYPRYIDPELSSPRLVELIKV